MANKKSETVSRKKNSSNISTDYLFSVADKIHKETPTIPIILNVLKDVLGVGYEKGYAQSTRDKRIVREKHIRRHKESFDNEIEKLEDIIYPNKKK